MNLGTFTKQPVEALDYDIDYSAWLLSDDSIESATVVSDLPGITVDLVLINSPFIKVWLRGGVNGEKYKITCTMTTSDGRVKQDEFTVKVKDY